MQVETEDYLQHFQKMLLVLRSLLIGRKYFYALTALEFAMRFHVGKRKDGFTPEFDHQVSIALYALTLPDLIDEEGTLVTIILHDTPEDYPVTGHDIMQAIFPNPEDHAFGERCVQSIELMNKYNRDGSPKDEEALYRAVAADPRASIAKPADRVHNMKTMVGVFSYEKQLEYIEFAETRILPMMKVARRLCPRQTMAYLNMKAMLTMQIDLIRAMHEGVTLSDARRIEIKAA